MSLYNADELKAILDTHGNVKGIFFGHYHKDHQFNWGTIPGWIAPSTAPYHLFESLESEKVCGVSTTAPAYSVHHLNDDGISSKITEAQ